MVVKKKDNKPIGAVLVVGGGIGGIQASLDLAESGFKVYLVERGLSIGGVMAQLDKTFPTNDCAMCILSPKLVEAGRHRNIEIFTNAEVEKVEGEAGNFKVVVKKNPRYVDLVRCTGCGDCATACPIEIPDAYQEGLSLRKAIYRPFEQAMPSVFGIEKRGLSPCRAACPLQTNAQGYVALISKGKFLEALKLIREKNPLPGICGRVCTHPCEDECKRKEVDEPIAIAWLKRFVADYVEDIEEEPPKVEREERVAIIGAGPAGLVAGYDLRKMGYKVTIFDALPFAGGMLAIGIPEFRLPKKILQREIDLMVKLGIELKLNTVIGRDLTIEDLKSNSYKAIFIAIGAHLGMKLGVPGEDLKGVYQAIEFLSKVNLGKNAQVGERIAIIGGGNVAIDAARTAHRLGAKKVTIFYRRSRAEMPASKHEIEEAEKERIEIHYLVNPKRIIGEDGLVKMIECVRMRLGEPDESGRRRPIPIDGSEFRVGVDTVIVAIGQFPDISPLGKEFNLTQEDTFIVDLETLRTNIEGIFAGGDCVTGPNTVIEAMAMGRKAAISIDRYIRGEVQKLEREVKETLKSEIKINIEGVEVKSRALMPTLPLAAREGSFSEVDLGFGEEEAIEEAKRCLACGGCSECMECIKVCKAEAIVHSMAEEEIILNVGSIILSPGFDEFKPDLKEEYGYGLFPNVLSSIEFERILSASGPYKGKILRLSDRKPPKKIAWIQCVGSRDLKVGNGYCSSVCCMYATKEALIVKEHDPSIETTIFYLDLRAYGKDFDKYIERAKGKYGVRYIRARVAKVAEDPKTNNLKLRYETEEGKFYNEEFEMVILSVGLKASQSARELGEKFTLDLNRYGFASTTDFEPLKSSRRGVYVGGLFSGPKDIPETVAQASGVAAEASILLSKARGTLVQKRELPPEIDVRNEPPRIGVFICHCGMNIAGTIDIPCLVEYAKTLPDVIYAEDNLYTCSQDTQERIKKIIKEQNLNRVVVASCTPRTHEPLFQETIREGGLNKYLFEMANIRDQDSWVHRDEPEPATVKAKDLLRMAVAKARLREPLYPISLSLIPKGLVLGGGLTGIIAALGLAGAGFEVYLIEKEAELGGNTKKIYYTLEGGDVHKYLKELISRLKLNSRIHIFTNTEVEKIEGFVGNFKTTVKTRYQEQGTRNQELEHGVIIVATGAEEYQPQEYLYGKDDRVITQRELERRLATSDPYLATCNLLIMIQCIGSRNGEHPYCSRICCSEAIKNAIKIKERRKGANVYVLYRDIRTYGFKEEYYEKAREMGVVFIRYEEGEEPVVRKNGDKLEVMVEDNILGEKLLLEADLLVLSTATVPSPSNQKLAQMLKVPLNEDGFFLEAHMKLRPVEFATEGIFLVGLAHSPKFIEESISQANAAVSRAITILSKDRLEVMGMVAQVEEKRCSGCGLCMELCSYRAIELVTKKILAKEGKVAQINEALCKGCGLCVASCRSGAIDLRGFTDKEILEQIRAIA